MADYRGYGSYQEGPQPWPPADKASEPRYQPPADYYAPSSSWAETSYIPAAILKQAEARVAAQKRFFKHLFIYLAIVSAVWLIGISQTMLHYSDIDLSEKMVGIFVPLFITIIGAIRVAYSYFLAYVWEKKTHQERIMREVQKLVS